MLVEEIIRDLAEKRPFLYVSVALRLAEHPEIPYPPNPSIVSNQIEELAAWAWEIPEVVIALKNQQPVNAIKAIRAYSGTTLYDAKKAWEHMKTMPQYKLLKVQ